MARTRQVGLMSLMIAAMANCRYAVSREDFIGLAEGIGINAPKAKRTLTILKFNGYVDKIKQDKNIEKRYVLTQRGKQRLLKDEREAQKRRAIVTNRLTRKSSQPQVLEKKCVPKIVQAKKKTVRANSLMWVYALKDVFSNNGELVRCVSESEFEVLLEGRSFPDADWREKLSRQEVVSMRDSMSRAQVVEICGTEIQIARIGQQMLYKYFKIGVSIPSRKKRLYEKLVASAQSFVHIGFHIETLRTSVRNLKRFLFECRASLVGALVCVLATIRRRKACV